jgi:magnesium-transporting ATPase (P-type)
MKQKPRDRESISKAQKISFIVLLIFFALVFSTAYFGTLSGTLPVFAENKIGFVPHFSSDSYNPADWSQAKARTMLLTVMAIAESTLVLSLRRANKPLYKVLLEDNYWVVWFFILLVPLIDIALMYIPSIQLFLSQAVGVNFDMISLTWIDWTIAITLGLLPIVLFEFTKERLRRRGSLF